MSIRKRHVPSSPNFDFLVAICNMADRYSFSLTTFSPSGKLIQIEYALNAVNGGATSVGIKGSCWKGITFLSIYA